MCKAQFGTEIVFSDGGAISLATVSDSRLTISQEIVSRAWRGPVWPTRVGQSRGFLFQATAPGDNRVGIFEASVASEPSFHRVAYGRFPAVCPHGEYVVVLGSQGLLVLYELRSRSEAASYSIVTIRHPPVWISANEIVFSDTTAPGTLDRLNVRTGEKRTANIGNKVLLFGSHPTSRTLYFRSWSAKSVWRSTYQATDLVESWWSRALTVSRSLIPLDSANSFIYARQTWGNLTRLSEVTSVFLHIDGEEHRIRENMSIFGGFKLP